jgi:hypothetical protein
MPISPHEARRRAKEQKASAATVHTYVITDPDFRPNAHGLGGVKSFIKEGKHCLVLTDQQARYWIDQGAIARDEQPVEEKGK